MHDVFEFGQVRTDGTAINAIMRPMSRFDRSASYDGARAKAAEALQGFYEKYRSATDTSHRELIGAQRALLEARRGMYDKTHTRKNPGVGLVIDGRASHSIAKSHRQII